MSWTGGTFYFPEKTKISQMEADIYECLYQNRGAMEPKSLPLKFLEQIPIQASQEDADEKLNALYTKYGREYDYAVRYYDTGKESKKEQDLQRRITELESKYKKYVALHSIHTLKADYIGCPNCGSRLRKDLLKGESCPLCRYDLRSKTTKETLDNYISKMGELEKQLRAEKTKNHSKNVCWAVHAEMYVG
jgi:hypothetical protein